MNVLCRRSEWSASVYLERGADSAFDCAFDPSGVEAGVIAGEMYAALGCSGRVVVFVQLAWRRDGGLAEGVSGAYPALGDSDAGEFGIYTRTEQFAHSGQGEVNAFALCE